MNKYKYTAVNLDKKKIKGTFIAENEQDLGEQLAKQGLYLVSSSIYTGNTPSAFFTLGTGKVTIAELTVFCRQFAIMLNTNIPILDCLDILKNQHFSSYFRKIIEVVYDDVKSGVLLSAALEKHGRVFPDFFKSMISVGEKSGKLDVVFVSLADYYETDTAIRRKVKSAMSYPLMLMGMTVGILVLMFALVIPTFRETLSDMDVEITGITKTVYDLHDFFLNNWQIMVVSIIFIVGGIVIALRTEKGKYVFDVLKLKLPMVKKITLNMITSRFARGFGLLLSSGMDLNDALDAIEIVLGNRYLKKRFHEAADAVRHGMALTVAFESYKIFPSMMIQMISIGERTASLDDVLMRSCTFFDNEVETSLNSLTSKIQPIMLMIMGVVVGTLFIAVYSPILSMMNGINR